MEFIHIETKEVVKIVSDEGNFYILSDGMKIDKSLFKQMYIPNTFVDKTNQESIHLNTSISKKQEEKRVIDDGVVDPNEFFRYDNNNYINIDNVLRVLNSIDTNSPAVYENINYDDYNTKKIIRNSDGEIESIEVKSNTDQTMDKNMMLLKNKLEQRNKNNNFYHKENSQQYYDDINNINTHQHYQNNIVYNNEDSRNKTYTTYENNNAAVNHTTYYNHDLKKEEFNNMFNNMNNIYDNANNINKSNMNNKDNITTPQENNCKNESVQEDPVNIVFKKFKRNYDIKILIEIDDKISNPEFIRVLSDAFEGDIIQFYTNEIYNNFIKNVDKIKNDIYNQIYKCVFGNTVTNEDVKENDNNGAKNISSEYKEVKESVDATNNTVSSVQKRDDSNVVTLNDDDLGSSDEKNLNEKQINSYINTEATNNKK